MKLVGVTELFDIARGTSLDLNALDEQLGGIAYVSCTAANNGVLARVAPVIDVQPNPSGVLSVALVGNAMATFVQDEPFYSAQNVAVLTPREPMSREVMLYYAACLRANHSRFCFGRKANRTMSSLLVPAMCEVPDWVGSVLSAEMSQFDATLAAQAQVASDSFTPAGELQASAESTLVLVSDLFEVLPGTSLELNALEQVDGGVPFVARSAKHNGVTAYVAAPPDVAPIPAGVLSVALGGSPMSTFLQEEPFYCGFHVACLVPRTPMSRAVLLYYAACLRANRYRFCFGRQANRSLASLKIPALHSVPAWVEHGVATAVGHLRGNLAAARDAAAPVLA